MADEALHSLLQILNHILKLSHRADVYREIISIHDEAAVLLLHLKNIPEYLEEQVRVVTIALEEIIQSLFSEDNQSYGQSALLTYELSDRLREAAEHFKSTAGDVLHSVNRKRRRLSDISPSVSSSSRTSTTGKDGVVGFDADLEQVRLRLLRSLPSQLQVLSIVGTGGIGKTTLAKLVYNDKLVVKGFDIRAWITVSQDYNVGNILSNLLASLEREVPYERKEELSTVSLIRRYLYHRRFLIVIDDTCSEKAWDDLKMVFPNTKFGSRIMLTTRLNDVAAYVDSSGPVHSMRLLNAHHSWNLLQKKVFVDGSCPPELVDVGKQIVKNCGGLPLSIVVVAGILYNLPKIPHSWKQIAENHGNLEALISLSCNHLPNYTRACFLYMGGFPEDYEIRASELIKLWIAEGFIKFRARSKSLEEVAAEVLENLLERNL